MRVQKILIILGLFFGMLLPFAFAGTGTLQNQTVNITVRISTAPNITTVVLGDFNGDPGQINLVAGGNQTVYCLVNATEFDGYAYLNQTSLNVSVYYQSRGYNGTNEPKYQYNLNFSSTTNVNACLNQSIGGGNESQGYIYYNCSISMPYYAINGTWVCNAQMADIVPGTTGLIGQASNTSALQQMIALNISRSIIDFGYMALGSNLSNANLNVTVENLGNVALSVDTFAENSSSTSTITNTYAMNCVTGYINETDVYLRDTSTAYQQYVGGASGTNGWYQFGIGAGDVNSGPVANGGTGDMSLVSADVTNRTYYPLFVALNLKNSKNMNPQPKGSCSGWLFFNAIFG